LARPTLVVDPFGLPRHSWSALHIVGCDGVLIPSSRTQYIAIVSEINSLVLEQ
jgi:hypothetical protein